MNSELNKMAPNEFDDALCKACPNLYADRNADMRSTCMCWGFEIGQGWQKLVWDLSEKIEALILKLPKRDRKRCKASQVKSKYAGLRFYMDGSTDEMDTLISEAEDLSERTCEVCGEPGSIYGRGWVTCYCPRCAEQRNMFVKTKEIE